MYAEFTENLATGNEMIDSQHKELIQKINDVVRRAATRLSRSRLWTSCPTTQNTISTQKNNFRRILSIPATTSTKPSMKNLRRP